VVLAAVALAAGIGRAGPADAQAPPPSAWRPEVDVRLAFARPFGNLEGAASTGGPADAAVSHVVTGALPVTVGLGLRRRGAFYAGLSGTFGYALAGRHGVCAGFVQCSQAGGGGNDWRTALEAQYRFLPDHPIGPWLGLGAGLEWLELDTATYRGVPLLDADVGVTLLSRTSSTLGLYLGLSAGRFVRAYDSGTGSHAFTVGPPPPPMPSSRTIDDPAWHGWLEIGARGTMGF
jgi:hypothetical protein